VRRSGPLPARPRGEDGNALVEFLYLAVLLMVPLVYVLLSVFLVQRAAFGVTEAARQAGRAYARAGGVEEGDVLARVAARTALADQGITGEPEMDAAFPDCPAGPCLEPGSRVRVSLRYTVPLPVLSVFFRGDTRPGIPVTARHTAVVDRFRAPDAP